MGVNNLWQILQPIAKPTKLEDLKDKTLAIDLSIWICENNSIKHNNPLFLKPHLRNLFFRCKSLLELDCTLVFIREGDVIELKKDTMIQRQNIRFGISASQSQVAALSQNIISDKSKRNMKRSQFESVINECCELLEFMGVPVIRSPCGEAEKACAYLNMISLCDGVVTEDSDVFLYGARVVYRNFNTDKKSDNLIEEYNMNDIEETLHLNRNNLVALGLVLGCDYDPKGIPGVGKESICKLMNEVEELDKKFNRKTNILDLMKNWKSSSYKGIGSKVEEKIRKNVLKNCAVDFPNEQIIREYLHIKNKAKEFLQIEFNNCNKHSRPKLKCLQHLMNRKLEWEYKYTSEKVVPLIVKYEYKCNHRSIKPICIEKTRQKEFKEYYQVKWNLMSELNKWNDTDMSDLESYTTLEKPDVFEKYHTQIVNEFKEALNSKSKKIKSVKSKKNVKDVNDELDEILRELDLNNKNSANSIKKIEKLIVKPEVIMKETKANKLIASLIENENDKEKHIKHKQTICIENTDDESDHSAFTPINRPKFIKTTNKLKSENDSIICLSDDDSNQIANNLQSRKNKNDIDELADILKEVRIQSNNNEPQVKHQANKYVEESPLPFHLRMKKKFTKASIFE